MVILAATGDAVIVQLLLPAQIVVVLVPIIPRHHHVQVAEMDVAVNVVMDVVAHVATIHLNHVVDVQLNVLLAAKRFVGNPVLEVVRQAVKALVAVVVLLHVLDIVKVVAFLVVEAIVLADV